MRERRPERKIAAVNRSAVQLGAAQWLECRDRLSGLEKGLASIAGEPGVRLERARAIAADADHDARVVTRATKQEREHRGTTEAAVSPDPSAAVQDAIDVECELRGDDALAPRGNAREPREGSVCREELERARHGRARGDDLELRAQPHASERELRSPRAAAVHHLPVYEGTLASADTSRRIHIPLGACPGTPHAMTYCPAGDALNVV